MGPKPRSYKQKTPKKMIQLALRSALSDRASEGRVAVVEAWDWSEPKTKVAEAALRSLGIDGKVLLVVGSEDELAFKAFRNLPHVHIQVRGELNAYDTLCSDWVVFTKEALPGGPNTDAPVHEPVEESNTIAPQVGLEDEQTEAGTDA
jgi:large subunit ribosomal protein L4